MSIPSTKKMTVTTSAFDGVERKAVQLTYLPQPDELKAILPNTHIALITNDGSPLTHSVYNALQAKGNRVVVLNLPGTSFETGAALDLSAYSDEAIAQAIQTLEQQYGPVGTFVHIHKHLTFSSGNFTQHFQHERQLLQTAFLLAKYLQPSLNTLGEQGERASFLTVTRLDGKLGTGRRSNTSILGGGLNGLVKCLNLEWSSVFCRAIDVQPEWAYTDMANAIVAELYDANRAILEVALSDEGRGTLSGIPVPVKEQHTIKTTVSENAVWLVSGGARGVTANCVIELAQTFGGKFILLGRSDATVEVPTYAKTENQPSVLNRLIMQDLMARGEKPNLATVKKMHNQIVAKKEIDATITAIEQAGGQVRYLKSDVTQLATIRPQLQALPTEWQTITGILHGAGRLADKYIQDKSAQDFHNVLSVKLDGLLTLLQCVSLDTLEHLVLFSSVAGFYGNVGQADYAMANEILSKAAHLFKTNHSNTHVSAINWGAWDAGMVSDALKKKFEEMGVTLVSSKGGPAMLINELQTAYADQPQVIIGGTLPAAISYTAGNLQTYTVKRTLIEADNPFLQHHVIQGNAVLPVVNAVGWMSQTAEQLYPDFRTFRVEDSRLFKGLVFDGTQPEQFTTTVQELEKSTEKIVVETTIYSQVSKAKLPTYHYKAKLTLVSNQKKINIPTHTATLSGCYSTTKGAQLYTSGALFHGAHFQGIERILDWTEQQIVLECRVPQVPLKEQGQFAVRSINTFFADIQYQGMVIWVQRYHEDAKSLPLSTRAATIYRPVPFGKILRVHIEIIEHTPFKMVAQCTSYDPDNGQVYLFTEQAAVTVSKELTW